MKKKLQVCLSVGLLMAISVFVPARVQAKVGVSPTSLDFGSVALNAKSSAATVVVTNQGGSYDAILRVASNLPEFVVLSPALPITLAPFGKASFQVIFSPDSAQKFSGSVIFTTRRTGGNGSSIAVSGTGTNPQTYLLSASPSNLNFGSNLAGSPVSEAVTLTNSGTAGVTISQASITGAGFFMSGFSNVVTLAAGQSMALAVTFAPRTPGSYSGSLSVTSNASNSPTLISLSGTGVQPQISVSPASVNFGSAIVGASSTQAATISNPGSANLIVTQATLSGAGFSITGLALPLTVRPGGSATFAMAFTPVSAGSLSGTLALVSNAPGSPLVVSAGGTGVASVVQLTVSPTTLSYGSQITGTSATQSVTLTNAGNSSVTVSQIGEKRRRIHRQQHYLTDHTRHRPVRHVHCFVRTDHRGQPFGDGDSNEQCDEFAVRNSVERNSCAAANVGDSGECQLWKRHRGSDEHAVAHHPEHWDSESQRDASGAGRDGL